MTPKRDQIVDILALLSLGEQLSDKDRAVLDNWRKQSLANEELFQKFGESDFKEKNLKALDNIPLDEGWNRFQAENLKTVRKPIFRLKNLMRYAAVMIGITLLCVLFYPYRQDKSIIRESSQLAKTSHDAHPAIQGAQLVLADGSQLALNPAQEVEATQGLSFKNSANTLEIKTDQIGSDLTLKENTLVVPKGYYYNIILPDQTKVWVNANSKLTFPTQFNKLERRVKLEGEAYFDVSHDTNHPFIVESSGSEIRVLGTRFNVNAYRKEIKTTLETGKVEFSTSGQKTVLSPGYTATWKNNRISVYKADLLKDLAWKNEEFYFLKDNIVDIAYILSQWYDVEVKFIGDIDLTKVFSGTMSRKLPLSQVLEVLKFSSDFQFEIRGKELLIKESNH